MCARIFLGALLCCGLASAETLLLPIDKIFLNISLFDEVDVVLDSPGTAFADVSPVELTGLGANAWLSTFLTPQDAMVSGPALTGLSSLALNLASKTDPLTVELHILYRGGEVRTMQLSYDGSTWALAVLPLTGQPEGVSLSTIGDSTVGKGGSGTDPPGSGGGFPTAPTDPTSIPEPSLTRVAGLALLVLVVGARRREAAASGSRTRLANGK